MACAVSGASTNLGRKDASRNDNCACSGRRGRSCRPILRFHTLAVWDGDGPNWCAERPHIRLWGIGAREIDGSCRPGHPCPAADPIAARDHLAELVGTPQGKLRTGHVKVSGPTMRSFVRNRARRIGGAQGAFDAIAVWEWPLSGPSRRADAIKVSIQRARWNATGHPMLPRFQAPLCAKADATEA